MCVLGGGDQNAPGAECERVNWNPARASAVGSKPKRSALDSEDHDAATCRFPTSDSTPPHSSQVTCGVWSQGELRTVRDSTIEKTSNYRATRRSCA